MKTYLRRLFLCTRRGKKAAGSPTYFTQRPLRSKVRNEYFAATPLLCARREKNHFKHDALSL
jgi:hypothetical protein